MKLISIYLRFELDSPISQLQSSKSMSKNIHIDIIMVTIRYVNCVVDLALTRYEKKNTIYQIFDRKVSTSTLLTVVLFEKKRKFRI